MAFTYYDQRNTDQPDMGSNIAVATWAFTTSALGAASEVSDRTIIGVVKRAVTIPDGTATPTAGWDLLITDEDGIDILGGAGGDRDMDGAGAAEQCYPSVNFPAVKSKLTFTVANGGNTKAGVVRLYYV
jgi:hypothetical protein